MFTSSKALYTSDAAGLLSGAAASRVRWPYLAFKEEKTPERRLLGVLTSSTCRSLRPESCKRNYVNKTVSREAGNRLLLPECAQKAQDSGATCQFEHKVPDWPSQSPKSLTEPPAPKRRRQISAKTSMRECLSYFAGTIAYKADMNRTMFVVKRLVDQGWGWETRS